MKLIYPYAIFKRTRVKVVTHVRIQNRWVISTLFLIAAIVLLVGIIYYKSIKTVDLSNYTVNNIGLNDQFKEKGYIVNKRIKIDRFKFYNDKNHKDLTIKVRNKNQVVKGIVLVKDKQVKTNFGVKIGSSVDDVIDELGDNYKKNNVGKHYKSVTYVDREHKMKLNILYRNDEIKRIEFFSR
ncbi:membrane protein [Staphylococcus saccharolyticus]|uniref:Membrane protein n=1 Tax=Staphylococcus saccharolyticus TaxID=33028 RepID=A0A380H3I7_9STAP|nr:hypothetical protein [Staphylococcus saccharolyticus]SUM70166.1 membrane protein [Staphylococcus saccharolyticus]